MKKSTLFGPSVVDEFARVPLEARLRKRLRLVVERLSKAPDRGFPQALQTTREREGFYRLLSNGRLKYRSLVKAHAEETVGRMTAGATVRVIHDTTEFSFSGEHEREGLGRLRTENSAQGFFAHVALAISDARIARPLGVVGAHCWARRKPSRGNRKLSGGELHKISGRESERWAALVDEVESTIGGRSSALHLMDSEGDSYALLAGMAARGARFVVRMGRDRTIFSGDHESGDDETLRLSEALIALPTLLTREVPLGRRVAKTTPRSSKKHPPRVARTATLALRAGPVVLKRPRYYGEELEESLALNVVYVSEVDAPTGIDPISWVLVTTEPVHTASDVEAVVDHYRSRWTIEEFFKALKTGCSFEERQLESFASLTNALALFFPIAWRMLLVRAISREDPDAPAASVLTTTQIAVLQHHQPDKMPLRNPTVTDALYAIAGQGGHFKHNGPPGWRTLAYGMEDLIKLSDAWDAGARSARNSRARSDQ